MNIRGLPSPLGLSPHTYHCRTLRKSRHSHNAVSSNWGTNPVRIVRRWSRYNLGELQGHFPYSLCPNQVCQRIWRLPWFGRVRVYLFSLWSVVVVFLALICWPCRGYEEHHMSSTMQTGMQIRIVKTRSIYVFVCCMQPSCSIYRLMAKLNRCPVGALSLCLWVVHPLSF